MSATGMRLSEHCSNAVRLLSVVVGIMFCLVAHAQSSEPSTTSLQQQILEALVAGHDAEALLAQVLEGNTSGVHSARPNRSTTAAELAQALADFDHLAQSLRTKSSLSRDDVLDAQRRYEAVLAAHLLQQQRFQHIENQLDGAGIGGDVARRGADAAARYKRELGTLMSHLGKTLGQLSGSAADDALLGDEAILRGHPP